MAAGLGQSALNFLPMAECRLGVAPVYDGESFDQDAGIGSALFDEALAFKVVLGRRPGSVPGQPSEPPMSE